MNAYVAALLLATVAQSQSMIQWSTIHWSTSGGIVNAPMVMVTCDEWKPKPKGCKIADGKTFDDLIEAILYERTQANGSLR